MKQEEQKIRSVFVQRETLETWLRQMAIKGWIVKDFSYIFFDSFLFFRFCLLYTSPSPRDYAASRMPSSA